MLVSIDPGKSGAFAIFDSKGSLQEVYKVKVPPKQRFFSWHELKDLWYYCSTAEIVVMEAFLDQRMPNQSPVANNTTACNHGMQQAIAMATRVPKLALLQPIYWKRKMGLINKSKSQSIVAARKLVDPSFLRVPGMRTDNIDIAEAILIGIVYGRENLEWKI